MSKVLKHVWYEVGSCEALCGLFRRGLGFQPQPMPSHMQVTDCYFPRDKYLNRRKNFCFVTFATQQVKLLDKVAKLSLHLSCVQAEGRMHYTSLCGIALLVL